MLEGKAVFGGHATQADPHIPPSPERMEYMANQGTGNIYIPKCHESTITTRTRAMAQRRISDMEMVETPTIPNTL
jgi:hypothetical protein